MRPTAFSSRSRRPRRELCRKVGAFSCGRYRSSMGLVFRKFIAMFRRRKSMDARYGGRVSILQVGALVIGDRSVPGVIQNVGLRGAFFAGGWLPKVGQRGTLLGPMGRPIPVRVVSRRRFGNAGVGLAFDS